METHSNYTILIVDDEEAILKSLKRVFRKEQYEVIPARSGREGLERLRQGGKEFSLIISDQRMPEMTGAEFLEKAKGVFPNAARMLLTGYSDMGAIIDAVNKGGIHRYLTKPWNDEDLLFQVRQALKEYDLVVENQRLLDLTKKQNQELNGLNLRLELRVVERTKEIIRAKQEWESTVNSLPQLIFLIDHQGSILRTNRTVERWNFAPRGDIKGCQIHDLFHPGCSDSGCYLEKFWLRARQELTQGRPAECEAEDPIWKCYLEIQVAPILSSRYAADNSSEYSVVVVQDITDRKRAQKEIADLGEQLRQSQKMEAIGRLAGGIAHDFNNLLTLIKGYAHLSLLELKENDPLKDSIEGIKKASERAADLTRQLLAFSRRQVMEMKVLDLNTLLRDLDKMLRRVIGENIELGTRLADDLGRVKADPGQLEQVILNLAVNARDAMPSGGKLTIETANVEMDEAFARAHIEVSPGRYVQLAVRDTGVGMTPEVQERVFEPFFTTKEKGKGTGLGLSMVYGIVKQSGGNIWLDSAPGQGTTFRIYLPRVDEPVEELAEKGAEKGAAEDLPRGPETVLVVEDDPEVLELSVRILNRQGYRVWQAVNGVEALRICEQHKEPIDLMLTDVVMPQMGGKELAEKVQPLRPQMKVLFTSGYMDDAVVHKGILNSGSHFLQKPFSPTVLAHKVREVLDG